MQTASGRLYWPSDPRPDEIHIEDIGHHLGMLCRFTGACREFYCVAEHSWHVSRLVSPDLALTALLHDATEAYLNDINKPTKVDPDMAGYRRLEERNWQAVAARFDLPRVLPEAVHVADRACYFAERAALMPEWPDGHKDMYPTMEVPNVRIRCWSPADAKFHFLQRFGELTRHLR